ncbi:DUF2828 family protein [Eubacterium sp. AB3007]|uniref:DUF2828 family protein n=1 Tax=Eubacterium sp. AB3007 TaxID=1392487 RepID=UPI00350F5295
MIDRNPVRVALVLSALDHLWKEVLEMLNMLKKQANQFYTENGAVTYRTTASDCLDLFSRIGAMRNAGEQDIIECFSRAYIENPDLTMKILFYARDVRGGLGERRVFRVIMNWLAGYNKTSVEKNIERIAEYGRFDDVVELMDTSCKDSVLAYIRKQLFADLAALEKQGSVSLLAKWLPSVNASNADTVRKAKSIARALNMSDAQYRKALSKLRAQIKIIENNLREKDYTFDYSKQPSKAMFKYRQAFIRNDNERYMEFLNRVEKGETKLNTSTLMPYDIIAPIVTQDNNYCAWSGTTIEINPAVRQSMNVSWNALEDFTDNRNALAVIDSSGSMYWGGTPIPEAVAISLGIYFAERNKGAFRNHFITFSETPRLVEVKGKDIVDKTVYCESFSEIGNTDVQKVFELLLDTAVENHLPQRDLPETLYIITDMEFDACVYGADITNFEYAKKQFARFGYILPQIVFWNIQSRNAQVPVTMNEQGVVLVSGCTPRLFSMIASGKYNPYDFMMEVIGSDRYAQIAA